MEASTASSCVVGSSGVCWLSQSSGVADGELRPGHLGFHVFDDGPGGSHTHISTAAGTLSGFGSLVGAVAMWAVGRITQRTGSFTIPMVSVAVAVAVSAIAAWAASRWPSESGQEASG